MAIKRIRVENFKSFKELDLELSPFNVVIGANASGKSNFTQVFKFLKDVEENNLKDAVALNGGMESLRNLTIGSSKPLSVKVELSLDAKSGWGKEQNVLLINEIHYSFALESGDKRNGLRITTEQLVQKFQIGEFSQGEPGLFEENPPRRGTCTVSNINGKPAYQFEPPGIVDEVDEYIPVRVFEKGDIPSNTLLIKTPFSLLPPWGELFSKTMIYNFDPHLARNPIQITGKADLQHDGGNLALTLARLLEDNENRRKLRNLLKDLLPFVEDIDTERFAEKSLMMTLRESYYESTNLPAYLLSDGTINLVALLVALYFEEKNVVIIEEPERYIHPQLVSRLIQMMKEVAEDKQVIVTTHSPEVVKHSGVENLLLVERQKDGCSIITRPEEKEHVKSFLGSELGLDDLYIQNILAD